MPLPPSRSRPATGWGESGASQMSQNDEPAELKGTRRMAIRSDVLKLGFYAWLQGRIRNSLMFRLPRLKNFLRICEGFPSLLPPVCSIYESNGTSGWS